MLDLKSIKDDTLLLVPSHLKNDILLQLSFNNILKNIKLMTMNEFLKNYLFDYDKKTIYYIMNKFNVKVDIALVYLRNLYYIGDEDYGYTKLQFLKKLKQELLDNHLLICNPLFKSRLKSKHILVYGIQFQKFELKVLNELENITDVTIIPSLAEEDYQHVIYQAKDIEEEVTFIAERICELLEQGITSQNIYLTNVNGEYKATIKRIFSFYHLPVDLQEDSFLYSVKMGQFFLEHIDKDITKTLELLKENFNLTDDVIAYQYNQILSICNSYNFIDDYTKIKDLLVYDLKKTKSSNQSLEQCIRIINLEEYRCLEEAHVFLLGFSQGVFPITEKDEDYLNDTIKEKLGLEITVEKNSNHLESAIRFIKTTKNLIITYPLYNGTPLEISNLNEVLQYPVIDKIELTYRYSHLYNQLMLGKRLDDYMKYGVVSDDLSLLQNTYPNNNYLTYNNQYTPIDSNRIKQYKKNYFTLSYSSIDNYFHCAFRFYISNILKLNIYEENFMNYIGSLFHYVLSEIYKDDFDFETSWNTFLEDNPKDFSHKELFFLKKLKQELIFIIDIVKKQAEYSNYSQYLLEEKIAIDKSIDDLKIEFVGIIDKIFYGERLGKKEVAIIDYKTGNPSLDLSKVPYGMSMQLPIYLYLLKNKWKDADVVGFYLQKIIPSVINKEPKKSFLIQKQSYLKLQGYSLNDETLLEQFDKTYMDSELIKSMKMTSKGFASYSKVLNKEKMNGLFELVDKNIDIAIRDIVSAKYDINPKQVGKDLVGCGFCSFKDICFKNHKDIVHLKEYKDLSFLGGEDNA